MFGVTVVLGTGLPQTLKVKVRCNQLCEGNSTGCDTLWGWCCRRPLFPSRSAVGSEPRGGCGSLVAGFTLSASLTVTRNLTGHPDSSPTPVLAP